jgi:protein DEK
MADPEPAAGREKRERKSTVDVYVVASPTKKEFVIPEGKGTKLRDIPNGARARKQLKTQQPSCLQIRSIDPPAPSPSSASHPLLPPLPFTRVASRRIAVDFNLNKFKSDDEHLKLLHRVMYNRPGKATTIKKNIRDFSGLVLDDAKERDRVKGLIDRIMGTTLNTLLDLLDLPRGAGAEGVKDAKAARLLSWLESPAATEGKKNLKAIAEVKKEKAARKRERVAAKKEKLAKKKARDAKKKSKSVGGGGVKTGGRLPDDAAGIKAELAAIAKRKTALERKLATVVGAKRKASGGGGGKSPASKKAKKEDGSDDDADDDDDDDDSGSDDSGSDDDVSGSDESGDDEKDEEEEADAKEAEEEEEKPPTPPPAPPAKEPTPPPAKESTPPPAPAPPAAEKEPTTPSVASAPPPGPTDAQLCAAVKEMLSGADLASVSMKKIRADLEAKFGVSLVEKKATIKAFVESAIE